MSYSESSDDEPMVDITQWAPRQTMRPSAAPMRAPVATMQSKTKSPNVEITTSGSESSFDADSPGVEVQSPAAAHMEDVQSRSGSESDQEINVFDGAKPSSHTDVKVVIDRPAGFRPEDYEDATAGQDVVRSVLSETKAGDDLLYVLEFRDGHREKVSSSFVSD